MKGPKELRKLEDNRIAADYVAIMKDVILKGYEWHVPNVGSFKIVKMMPPVSIKDSKGEYFCVNRMWYKLDISFEAKDKRFITKYKTANILKKKAKELIKNNIIDYRAV